MQEEPAWWVQSPRGCPPLRPQRGLCPAAILGQALTARLGEPLWPVWPPPPSCPHSGSEDPLSPGRVDKPVCPTGGSRLSCTELFSRKPHPVPTGGGPRLGAGEQGSAPPLHEAVTLSSIVVPTPRPPCPKRATERAGGRVCGRGWRACSTSRGLDGGLCLAGVGVGRRREARGTNQTQQVFSPGSPRLSSSYSCS